MGSPNALLNLALGNLDSIKVKVGFRNLHFCLVMLEIGHPHRPLVTNDHTGIQNFPW